MPDDPLKRVVREDLGPQPNEAGRMRPLSTLSDITGRRGRPPQMPRVKTKVFSKRRVLQSERFKNAAGTILWVRLVQHTAASGQLTYVVRWAARPKKGRGASGNTAVSPAEDEGRVHYGSALKAAAAEGWVPFPREIGRRASDYIAPIPPAAKRAPRRTR